MPKNGVIFQQDNALCHRAKNTSHCFETQGIVPIELPAQSSKLNPIEHLRETLGKAIRGTTITKKERFYQKLRLMDFNCT